MAEIEKLLTTKNVSKETIVGIAMVKITVSVIAKSLVTNKKSVQTVENF